ncbi:MAG: histidinol-phosphate transaminase [Candidatus Acidiferrales bacterium]|jgi:histidinol-phosphate aminotransferase
MKPPIPARKAVARMRPYHPPLEGRDGKLRLDFNENTIGCSPKARQAIRNLASATVSMYPEQETVRRELARFFGVHNDELLLTNGTDEALHLIADTFLEPRGTVLLVEPTFAMYRFYSELAGARIQALRYDATMQFPMKALLAALRKLPRIFFLANPNNPTGSVLRPAELRRILKAATQTLVVVDEAYFEFSGITILPWIRRYNNLVVTRTFSKAAGLAGLRLGCIFANRSITEHFRKAQSPYPVNVAALAAARATARDQNFLRSTLHEFHRSRRELERGLTKLGIPFFPTAANFVLLLLGSRAKAVVASLARQGTLIRDRSSDFGGAGYVRITFGTLSQTRRVLRQLKEIL